MARFFNGPYHHNNPPVVMSVLRPGLLGAGFATYTKKKMKNHTRILLKKKIQVVYVSRLYTSKLFS